MTKIKTPFFVVNPKAYLYGKQSLDLALVADRLAAETGINVFFTCQHVDAALITANTENLLVTVQHMDPLVPGKGMGYILPEALKEAGVAAVFLNHAEHPMTLSQLAQTMKRAKELDLATIVCADSLLEGKALAQLEPTIMVCEPTELIGTGQTSSAAYMSKTNEAIRSISPDTLVLQAAGISTAADAYQALASGADGTGATSGIVCHENPAKILTEMINEAVKFKDEE